MDQVPTETILLRMLVEVIGNTRMKNLQALIGPLVRRGSMPYPPKNPILAVGLSSLGLRLLVVTVPVWLFSQNLWFTTGNNSPSRWSWYFPQRRKTRVAEHLVQTSLFNILTMTTKSPHANCPTLRTSDFQVLLSLASLSTSFCWF